MLIPVPDMIRHHLAQRTQPPVEPKDASTIVLLRERPTGMETYLMRRHPNMVFAAGMHVFPGGGVQKNDLEPIEMTGPSWSQWGDRFGMEPERAQGLVVAAIRETFEESGILLAGPSEDTVLDDTSSEEFAAARIALENKDMSLSQFLTSQGLIMRADLIGPWSRWITPEFEPRRYDTFFFVAAVPEGQKVGVMAGEADRAGWASIETILQAVRDGQTAMLPPTEITCRQVRDLDLASAVELANQRKIFPIEPKLVQIDGEWFLQNNSDEEPS